MRLHHTLKGCLAIAGTLSLLWLNTQTVLAQPQTDRLPNLWLVPGQPAPPMTILPEPQWLIQQPAQPAQPTQPGQPGQQTEPEPTAAPPSVFQDIAPTADTAAPAETSAPFSPQLTPEQVTGEDRQTTARSMAVNIISGNESFARSATDAGSLLKLSQVDPGVVVQQRNPIFGDPRIRGLRFGQYLARADGGMWYPARLDVDSVISKIDAHMIDDIIVIMGPYSARYGPAFSFIDIVTRRTPRYDCGYDWEASNSMNYNINGAQWFGNQYVQGGGRNWGYSVYYSDLLGADYSDGLGNKIPSSYHSRNINAALGFGPADGTTVEFRYLRQDLTDVELAGQFTDLDYLVTDGYSLNLTSRDSDFYSLLTFDAWYNRTRAQGSGGRSAKQTLFNNVFSARPAALPRNSFSNFGVTSIGYSLAMTWGSSDRMQLTVGSDLRYYQRELSELQIRPPGGAPLSATNDVFALIPRSQSFNPGVFAELVIPATDRLRIKTGSRVDWVSTHADPGAIIRLGGNRPPLDVLGPDRDNSYQLWSAYVTAEYDLNDNWTAALGYGMAERPPLLTELYAMRPFESVLQQGLNRIQGDPRLDPERLKQIDAELRYRSKRGYGGVRFFYSWIHDYITSQGIAIDPTSNGARINSVFVNTPEATLAGGEAYGQMDLTKYLSLFGSLMYVEGRNQELNDFIFNAATAPAGSSQGAFFGRTPTFDQNPGVEPLPGIPPLESRAGIRVHQPGNDPAWGTEFAVRMVAAQDRVANRSLLEQITPGFTTMDIRFFWRPAEGVLFIAGATNFTNRQYREHLDPVAGNQLFQPGASGYFGAQLTY